MARLNPRKPDQIYGGGLHDAADRSILVVAFLLGAVGGAILKLEGHRLIPWTESIVWLSAAWAAAALFLYAGVASAIGRARIEPETVGDNCYYLGFLFTLTSLAVTLYQLSGLDSSNVLRDIISGFGVALSSTIVGVALRVWFFQFRSGLIARDRETRVALQQAAREFRASVTASLQDLKKFAAESTQLAAERNQKIDKATADALESHNDRLVKNAEEFSRTIAETFRTAFESSAREMNSAIVKITEEALADVKVPIVELGNRLDAFREQELNSLENLASHLNSVESEFRNLSTALQDVSSRIGGLSGNIGRGAGALDAEFVKATNKIRDASEEMGRQMSSARALAEIDVAGSDLKRVSESLAATVDRLQRLEAVSSSIASGLREGAESLRHSSDRMIREFNHLLTSDVLESVTTKDSKAERSISEVTEQFDELARRIDGLVESILLELTHAANQSREASSAARDNSNRLLVSAAKLREMRNESGNSAASREGPLTRIMRFIAGRRSPRSGHRKE